MSFLRVGIIQLYRYIAWCFSSWKYTHLS